MRILIDDGMQIDVKTGIGKYTEYLFNYLKKANIDVSLKKHSNNFKKKIFGRFKYLLYINSNKYMKETNSFDIIHYTNYVIPFRRNRKIKYVVTIHDLVTFKYSNTLPFLYRLYSKITTKYSIKHSDMIFTVSESVKNEIIELFPYAKNKIFVGYPGLYDDMAIQPSKSSFDNDVLKGLKSNFFLFVGTIELRKNIGFVIDAFLKFKDKYNTDFKLVLAGKPGYGYDTFVEKINNSQHAEDVIFTGFISSNDACLLYEKASAYIFPSVYEGFGCPQLECMIHHTPLICSNIPTNVEVSKEYAVFFELENVDSLVKSMETVYEGNLNKDIEAIGDSIIKKYYWSELINDYINSYNLVFERKINER